MHKKYNLGLNSDETQTSGRSMTELDFPVAILVGIIRCKFENEEQFGNVYAKNASVKAKHKSQ